MVLEPGRDGSKESEKTLASARCVDVSSAGTREVCLRGRTKGTAREYFVSWRFMTCSKCAISSSEEGQGSISGYE